MIEIKLKAKEERRLLAGRYWVFSNEIDGLGSIEVSNPSISLENTQ